MPDTIHKPVPTWEVDNPLGSSEKVWRRVRDEVEARVLGLLEELRKGRAALI